MSKSVKVIVAVAVRLKSSRLPRKALTDISGKPLIVHLTERLAKAKLPEAIYWCTSTHPEDDVLEELSEETDAWIYRGDELDVLSRFIEVGWSRNAETIIRVTGDNPLTDPVMLDYMLEKHRAEKADYTYTEALPRGTRCEVISMEALEKCHELAEDPASSEYMTYMLKQPDIFNVLNVEAYDEKVNRPDLRLTVDYPEDLEVIKKIYDVFDGNPSDLPEIIKWLDENKDVASINQHLKPIDIDDSINVKLREP